MVVGGPVGSFQVLFHDALDDLSVILAGTQEIMCGVGLRVKSHGCSRAELRAESCKLFVSRHESDLIVQIDVDLASDCHVLDQDEILENSGQYPGLLV